MTWNNIRLWNATEEIYATAEKVHNDSVRDTLSGTVEPPLLRPDGSLTHFLKEKAALFADVFDSKQSSDSLIMPQSCFPEAELTTFAFHSGEVKKLLFELDRYGGAGCDGIFFFFLNCQLLSSKDFYCFV